MMDTGRLVVFLILIGLSMGAFGLDGDITESSCPKDMKYAGNIYSPATVQLIQPLRDNLGLFRLHNHSDWPVEFEVSGMQDGYHRHVLFLGYLFMDLNAQDTGWQYTGVYDEAEEEPSNAREYQRGYSRTTIAPGESIEFITIIWPKSFQEKGRYAVRLYLHIGIPKAANNYLLISEPYCL